MSGDEGEMRLAMAAGAWLLLMAASEDHAMERRGKAGLTRSHVLRLRGGMESSKLQKDSCFRLLGEQDQESDFHSSEENPDDPYTIKKILEGPPCGLDEIEQGLIEDIKNDPFNVCFLASYAQILLKHRNKPEEAAKYAAKARLLDPYHWWVQVHAPDYLDGYEHVVESVKEQLIAEGYDMERYKSFLARQQEEVILQEKIAAGLNSGDGFTIPPLHQTNDDEIVNEDTADRDTSSSSLEEYSLDDSVGSSTGSTSSSSSKSSSTEVKTKQEPIHNLIVESSSDVYTTNSSLDPEEQRYMDEIVSAPSFSQDEEMDDEDQGSEFPQGYKSDDEDEEHELFRESPVPKEEEEEGEEEEEEDLRQGSQMQAEDIKHLIRGDDMLKEESEEL
ncbi:hypothetical protein GUITHDRAFT_132066 [Guillardia theta CCMP2712]|uniref:Uncharacterized protein n=1 Tax=Guillardia theta (strain CCMP2712) TaxID=905079 RepID=L1K197_GUITC|nr:hypothetical protein GUITHDRAFT_132066 [Guillardia theta CCMP2712]EKX54314.1 hypothetical protein GUITHDRAFT_132066 [Guillardia theta CCMP2712]|eukprot:XP_005841294.1 hypothetical protein GUITHDRAFT_132066 [Guillardia theta CCMP2712]